MAFNQIMKLPTRKIVALRFLLSNSKKKIILITFDIIIFAIINYKIKSFFQLDVYKQKFALGKT